MDSILIIKSYFLFLSVKHSEGQYIPMRYDKIYDRVYSLACYDEKHSLIFDLTSRWNLRMR